MDIVIEENILEKYILETHSKSPHGHKGIRNLLLDVMKLGYLWDNNHRIILYDGQCSSDSDGDYAKYLDKRASGLKVKFK